MAEKSVNEIGRELRGMYEKGMVALERKNFDYAIAFFTQVLQREPGFFECRKALRATQFKKSGGNTSFFKKMVGGASSSPMVAMAQLSLRKSPLEALATAEQILNSDPGNTAAHKIIAEASMAAEFPLTAVLTFEILKKNSGLDFDQSMNYGRALANSGQAEKAETVYEELQRSYPRRPEVQEAMKNLSARRTMDEQGYSALSSGTGSYRDILRNKAEAASLEQEKRVVKTDDVAANLIAENELRLAQEPNNFKLLCTIADLYTQRKEFDRALEYYQRARAVENVIDPTLDKIISDISRRKIEHQISLLNPENPEHAAQVAQLTQERAAHQLKECLRRVEQFPTDLQMRFELGQLYFQLGKLTEAIQEFQKAQNNPNRRLQCISYLGQCFAARGNYDIAARKFLDALKEKVGFDDETKELHYHLGTVLEKLGKRHEAVEQFKIIFEQDIGYRDVAAKVDAYSRDGGAS